ncbi:MAG: HAMP domain-containing histidine kinase [Deltaproteobacteria bacterium]|nr:HAMP domain-containing histidine kinase [Deltaproteobacteria bacterium]
MFPALKKRERKLYDYEQIFKRLMTTFSTLERASENVYEILKTVIHMVEADEGSLFLYQKSVHLFVLKKWVGEKPLNMSISGDYEFLTYLKQVTQTLFKDEVLHDGRYLDVRSAGLHYFTQLSCVAVVPLLVKGEWIGLLNIGRGAKNRIFGEEDRDLLFQLGCWLAHNLSNAVLYEEVRRQNKKLAEMTEMKNQLMANVTHELRTPLAGILGLTDLIIEGTDGPVTEDQRRHLNMVKAAGESLLDIVNNILSMIKIEAGKGVSTIRRIELGPMIVGVAEIFEGVFVSQENHFQSHVPHDFLVYGDEDQIRTVLVNLIGNAAKFTRQGQIEVQAVKSGEMAKICVRDSGIGIDPSDQEKIFEEFRQADGSMTRSYGGTGLGLAIAKRIVELHGGRIWVDSVLGKGSEFYLTLPLRPTGIQATEVE